MLKYYELETGTPMVHFLARQFEANADIGFKGCFPCAGKRWASVSASAPAPKERRVAASNAQPRRCDRTARPGRVRNGAEVEQRTASIGSGHSRGGRAVAPARIGRAHQRRQTSGRRHRRFSDHGAHVHRGTGAACRQAIGGSRWSRVSWLRAVSPPGWWRRR